MPVAYRLEVRPLIVAAGSLFLAAGVAVAQIPGISKPAPPQTPAPAKAEVKETSEQMRARIRKLLDEVHAQSERPPARVPEGIDPHEVAALHEAQNKLIYDYDAILSALDKLGQARSYRPVVEASERNWTGFETPPPYSVLRLDELRDAAGIARDRIGPLETFVAQLSHDAVRARDELQKADEELRLAQETFDLAKTPDDSARANWRLELARLKDRAAGADLTSIDLRKENFAENLAIRQSESRLLERQIAVMSQQIAYTDADLASARQRIEERTKGARAELAEIEAQTAARLRERDLASESLARVRARAKAPAADVATAEARLEAAQAAIDADRIQVDALGSVVALGGQESSLWGARDAAFRGTDAESRRIAEATLREAAAANARERALDESWLRQTRGNVVAARERLNRAGLPPAALRYAQLALDAHLRALLAVGQQQLVLDGMVRELGYWLADLDQATERRSPGARLSDAWLVLRDWARKVWDFELFQVEDTALVEGHSVTVERGVTVGKSIGALLVFLVGYLVTAAILRRLETRVVAGGTERARARNARRWLMTLFVIVLLLVTFNIARIPLSVFGFLGGALAIGVGFGAQTLIKNFISGLVLMRERKLRLGDTIDVAGTIGIITDLNLRSTLVLQADGSQAIIPNSVLVESKVTNWTLDDRKVRKVIKVGVAYGTPLRKAADLLLECAKGHEQVLSDPAPSVMFENFGKKTITLALYVWLQQAPNVNSVLSDLGFAIETRFAEAGIVMAHPQRHLHFDTAQALRVEVVRDPPSDQSK